MKMTNDIISYNEAINIIREVASFKKLGIEKVLLEDAVGRVCAQDVMATLDIQPFDNAAMDGFAVSVDDLKTACVNHPVILTKRGIIAAGEVSLGRVVHSGECWHIMTGAPVPTGVDAIVPIEDITIQDQKIFFTAPVKSGNHVRKAGEDFKKGTKISLIGEYITPTHMMPLASLGISSLDVFKKPRVLFLTTGTEIIDDLRTPLKEGQIYNSNKSYGLSFLRACNVDVVTQDPIQDDPIIFCDTIKSAQKNGYDLVISSGAVSAGAFDFVKDGLQSLGAEILYHKIKLKPGKPNLFARLPDGVLYFGLPGNPVATAVGLRFFVYEALRTLQGRGPEMPIIGQVINDFSKKPDMHMVLKSSYHYRKDGTIGVEILDGQESFMVSPFLRMNGWVPVPQGVGTIKKGSLVDIYPTIPH